MSKINWVSAGTFPLTKNAKGEYMVYLIYKKWSEDNQGWVPPKGKVEEGESFKQAALRETMEETGLTDLRIGEFVGETKFDGKDEFGRDFSKVTEWYLSFTDKLEDDHKHLGKWEQKTQTQSQWFPLSVAVEKLKFDNDREMLKQVVKYLNAQV